MTKKESEKEELDLISSAQKIKKISFSDLNVAVEVISTDDSLDAIASKALSVFRKIRKPPHNNDMSIS